MELIKNIMLRIKLMLLVSDVWSLKLYENASSRHRNLLLLLLYSLFTTIFGAV
jgi:hypothetical protein